MERQLEKIKMEVDRALLSLYASNKIELLIKIVGKGSLNYLGAKTE
jgi:hypothetical protein